MKNFSERLKDPIAWAWGLVSGMIGGGATAALSTFGLMAGNEFDASIPLLNFKGICIVFVSGALVSAFTYLKQSPLPTLENESGS